MLDWLWNWTLPGFGTAVLYAVLVAAGYTFSVSLAAARGRPRLLQSAGYLEPQNLPGLTAPVL